MSTESAPLVTSADYERLALAEDGSDLELHRGRLRRKPAMTMDHNDIAFQLGHLLASQLDRSAYRVRVNSGRARLGGDSYYIPDVMVIPARMALALKGQPGRVEAYERPLPLVIEVWSRSTGDYDATEKLAEYRARGDHEIWLVHLYEQTVRVWRRAQNEGPGGYTELTFDASDTLSPATLPSENIALADVFDGG